MAGQDDCFSGNYQYTLSTFAPLNNPAVFPADFQPFPDVLNQNEQQINNHMNLSSQDYQYIRKTERHIQSNRTGSYTSEQDLSKNISSFSQNTESGERVGDREKSKMASSLARSPYTSLRNVLTEDKLNDHKTVQENELQKSQEVELGKNSKGDISGAHKSLNTADNAAKMEISINQSLIATVKEEADEVKEERLDDSEESDASTIVDDSETEYTETSSAKKGKIAKQKTVSVEDLTCKLCLKTVKSVRALEKHMNLHSGKHACPICQKPCNSEYSLKRHVLMHEGFGGDQVCKVCDKTFYDKSSLNKHTVSVHMGITHHQCEYCSKSFFARKTYEEHVRVHTGERPFKCDQCEKTYKRISDLNYHKKLHTGENSHTCEICGLGCRRSYDLKRHMLKHNINASATTDTLPKVFTCKWCGVQFSNTRALTNHMDTHCDKAHLDKTVGNVLRQDRGPDQFTAEKQKLVDQIVQHLGSGFSCDMEQGYSQPVMGPMAALGNPGASVLSDFQQSNVVANESLPLFWARQPSDTITGLMPPSGVFLNDGSSVSTSSLNLLGVKSEILDSFTQSAENSNLKTDEKQNTQDTLDDLSTLKNEDTDSYSDCEVYLDNPVGDSDDDFDSLDTKIDSVDKVEKEGKNKKKGKIIEKEGNNETTQIEGSKKRKQAVPKHKSKTFLRVALTNISDSKDTHSELIDIKVETNKKQKGKKKVNTTLSDVTDDSDDTYISSVSANENGNDLSSDDLDKNKAAKRRKQVKPKKRKPLEKEVVENTGPSDPEMNSERSKNKKETKTSKTKSKSLFCDQCCRKFSTSSALRKHLNLHNGAFTCELCGKLFASEHSLKTHMDIHEGKKISKAKCNVCEKMFFDISSLNRHVNSVHLDYKPYACTFCDKKMADKKTLAEHLRVHTGEKPFTCETCGQSYKRASELNFHIRKKHTDEINDAKYKCEDCGKRFLRPSHLRMHMEEKHNPDNPFTCTKCRRRFHSQSMLKDHQETHVHKVDKKHSCDKCGKRFAQIHKLKRHQSIKADCMQRAFYKDGVYYCKFCYAEFSTMDARDLHLKENHASDKLAKIVVCTVCGKNFGRPQALKLHMKIHFQIRDFKCAHCDASFVQKHHLVQHMRTHTGEKPYQCHICNRNFAQSATLYSHMKHH